MKHLFTFVLLIFVAQATAEEDFKLWLDGQAKPTLPMPRQPVSEVSARGEEKLSDLSRFYFAVVSYTSTLEKDLRNLKATPLVVSDAASLGALRSASHSTNNVTRYLALLRPIADRAADPTLVQNAIENAEGALSRYEQLREEMVERKK